MRIIINENQHQFLIEVLSLAELYDKNFQQIPQDIFQQITQSDPTYDINKPNKMGKYTKWLASLYLNNNLKLEDLYKAKEYLTLYTKYYNKIDKEFQKIGKIQSLSQLYQIVAPFIEMTSQVSHQEEIRNIKKGAEKVYEDNVWLIIIPHTKEASCYYGKGTQWCTAATKSDNQFDYYNSQGELFININKQTNKKYQFHFESNSFMDETDSPIQEPICKTIGLTQGALNWYLENIEDAEVITQETIHIALHNSDETELKLVKQLNQEDWVLVYDNIQIATNIVAPLNDVELHMRQAELAEYGYTAFNNSYEAKTVITFDSNNPNGNCYLISYDAQKVGHLKYFNDIQENTSGFYKKKKKTHKLHIYTAPDGTEIYRKDASKVNKINVINSEVLQIDKTNGLSDLISLFGENIDDVQVIDDNTEYICVRDKNNNEIYVDSYSLEAYQGNPYEE